MLPGGRGLINAIEVGISDSLFLISFMKHIKRSEDSNDFTCDKPLYNYSPEQYKMVQLIQRGIRLHLKGIADNAKSVAGEVWSQNISPSKFYEGYL